MNATAELRAAHTDLANARKRLGRLRSRVAVSYDHGHGLTTADTLEHGCLEIRALQTMLAEQESMIVADVQPLPEDDVVLASLAA